ncbi:MAG: tRNA (guanosine(37)-N1)-methyltransferase TrmD [Rectinemataceae bacterium]
MNITVLSLFPEMLRGFFESSIMARAVKRGLVSYELIDIRDYATDRHRKCDDEVFGGGPGMLMLPLPLGAALEAAGSPAKRTIYLTPSGRLFNQTMARDFAAERDLVLVCGHYEGIDQRVIDRYVTDEVSIGDYVLSSGEVAALVLIDAVYRLVEGVIKGESLAEESFGLGLPGDSEGRSAAGLLEYPQYTRPAHYANMPVPEVLTSGHHANIARWRLRESLRKTLAYRPELLAAAGLPEEVRQLLHEIVVEGGSFEPYTEDPGRAD